MIDKYRALMDGLSLESLLSFVKEFKSQLFVEGLVQGNVTSTVSVESMLLWAGRNAARKPAGASVLFQWGSLAGKVKVMERVAPLRLDQCDQEPGLSDV